MKKLISKNFVTLFSFEILYSFLLSFGVVPLIRFIFNLTLSHVDESFIELDNIFSYLKSPITIILLLIMLFLVCVSMMLEVYAINIMFVYSKKQESINILTLIPLTFSRMSNVFKSKSISLYLYIALMIPFQSFIYTNPLVESLSIPDFALEYYAENNVLSLLILLGEGIILIYVLINTYTFLYMFNDGTNFKKSKSNSRILLKNHLKELLIAFGKIAIIIVVAMLGKSLLEYLLIIITPNDIIGNTSVVISSIALSVNLIVSSILDVVLKVIKLYFIASIFYKYNELPKFETTLRRNFKINALIYTSLFVLINVVYGTIYVGVEKNYIPNDVDIVAHRGSSGEALENTEEAFLLAMEEQTDYIELDVCLSADNEVVVFHDQSIERLSGITKNVSDMTLEELKSTKIYSSDGLNEAYIMSLKDLMSSINNDTILMIELKPYLGNEALLASEVEKIIASEPRHIVCSLNSSAIKEVKRINPSRMTGLILPMILGNTNGNDYVDFYSVAFDSLTKDFVTKIHAQNKKVYVWTINDLDLVEKYYDLDVDGIITDYPLQVSNEIEYCKIGAKYRQVKRLFDISNYSLVFTKMEGMNELFRTK